MNVNKKVKQIQFKNRYRNTSMCTEQILKKENIKFSVVINNEKKEECLYRQTRYIATNISFKTLILYLFLKYYIYIYIKQLYAKVRYSEAW